MLRILVYKRGDIVKVWSLQSFSNGGFLNGEIAIVRQDQTGSSVLLIVSRNIKGTYMLDLSYEVYTKQVELVSYTLDNGRSVENMLQEHNKFREFNYRKTGDQDFYSYSFEFFINEKNELELDIEKILYPEYII